MKILVFNGSPKGETSITLQSVHFLQNQFKEDTFEILHIGQQIRKYESKAEIENVARKIAACDLVLFSYPVYSFVAPYQLHRFIEVLKEYAPVDQFKGKPSTQITTSKHFYDVTAHKFIRENSFDLGFYVLNGLSQDMEDLLSKKGRKQLVDFWNYVRFAYDNHLFLKRNRARVTQTDQYEIQLKTGEKQERHDTLILTDCKPEDLSLKNMIEDFQHDYPYPTRTININDIPFSGGCLGCLHCAANGQCVYKDGFDKFLREKIQPADVIIFASRIKDHFMGSRFKLFNDRQFCDGHRMVSMGKPVGYILSGHYSQESNLQTIIEARSDVGHNYLIGVVSDEFSIETTKEAIQSFSKNLVYALDQHFVMPQNFWGIGGGKILRDLVYETSSLMKEDHRFYQEHGFYDFPQKQVIKRMKMKLLGSILNIPSVKKKIGGSMAKMMVEPYKKVISDGKF